MSPTRDGAAGAASKARQLAAAPARALFVLAALASAGLLLALGWDLTFLLDEWSFLLDRRELSTDALLQPHNEHLVLGAVLVYRALLELFGMDSQLPFRIVSTLAFILSVSLLYVWIRRRVGDWLALAACVLVLFCGAAWEDLLWPFQIGFFASMSFGIGALLALERGTPRGDALACALLVGALAFSSLGITFVVGAAAALAVSLFEQRRIPVERLYVAGVPTVLFAVWWLGWGHEADTAISGANFATSPQFVLDGLAASISGLLGLSTPSGSAPVSPLDWGRPLLVLAIVLAAYRLWRVRGASRWLWVALALALSFWLLAALNEKEGRDAVTSRYVYIGGIFVLMIAAELARGVRLRGPVAAALASVVVGAAALSGAYYLRESAKSYERTSELVKADLAAVELARDRVEPSFLLSPEIADTGYVHVPAGSYLEAADEHGSPANDESELIASPEHARVAADKVLARALGLTFTPTERPPRVAGAAPAVLFGKRAETRGSCAIARLGGSAAVAVFELPAGDAVVRAGRGARVDLRLRRFAGEAFPVQVGKLRGPEAAVLAIPADASQRPWQLSARGTGRVDVCGAGAA